MNSLVIGIAGGTGSGKSTFANRIKEYFGDWVTIIYHDNYYKSQEDVLLEERSKNNYDHPDSLETDMLIEHIKCLKKGIAVECPIYDFNMHNRTKSTYTINPNVIIIVEGILVLQNNDLRDLFDIKIYMEVDADERIMRRTVRDIKERGRKLDQIYEQYRRSVKPMHYLFVEPTKALADIVINNGLNDVAFDIIKTNIEKHISTVRDQK